jgi:hypothetical protein
MSILINNPLNILSNPSAYLNTNGNIISVDKLSTNLVITIVFTTVTGTPDLTHTISGNGLPGSFVITTVTANTMTITFNTSATNTVISLTTYNLHLYNSSGTIISEQESFQLETLSPVFTSTQQACTYTTILLNTSQASSSSSALVNNGFVSYTDVTNTPNLPLGSEPVNDGLTFGYLSAGTYQVQAILNIYRTNNQSQLIFQAISAIQTIILTEYKPALSFSNSFNACQTVNTSITVTPNLVTYNNSSPHNCGTNPTLTYTLTNPQGVVTTPTVITNPTTSSTFSFTPTNVGVYNLTCALTNCCTTTIITFNVVVCNSWTITNPSCNTLVLTNYSNTNLAFVLQVYNNSTNQFVTVTTTGSVPGGSYFQYTTPNDTIANITINSQTFYFILLCNVQTCLQQLESQLLCEKFDNCNSSQLFLLMTKFNRLNYLYWVLNGVYNQWRVYQNTSVASSLYGTYNLSNIQQGIYLTQDILNQVARICDNCTILDSGSEGTQFIETIGTNLTTNCTQVIQLPGDCGCNNQGY